MKLILLLVFVSLQFYKSTENGLSKYAQELSNSKIAV